GNTALWHQRLEHMSEKGMKIIASKCRIPDLQKAVRLELVHTNVYGSTSVASIGGSRYYVTFIDDISRKCLKFDDGGEYSSQEFIEYYVKNGIRMLTISSETPQQNDVVERMNRTLNKRAKSMRLYEGLLKMFWEDSFTTVT
ncbi:retrovirus-related pol polyprotein from transposon TNT 1-94, partial [Tanacetum coccineum]